MYARKYLSDAIAVADRPRLAMLHGEDGKPSRVVDGNEGAAVEAVLASLTDGVHRFEQQHFEHAAILGFDYRFADRRRGLGQSHRLLGGCHVDGRFLEGILALCLANPEVLGRFDDTAVGVDRVDENARRALVEHGPLGLHDRLAGTDHAVSLGVALNRRPSHDGRHACLFGFDSGDTIRLLLFANCRGQFRGLFLRGTFGRVGVDFPLGLELALDVGEGVVAADRGRRTLFQLKQRTQVDGLRVEEAAEQFDLLEPAVTTFLAAGEDDVAAGLGERNDTGIVLVAIAPQNLARIVPYAREHERQKREIVVADHLHEEGVSTVHDGADFNLMGRGVGDLHQRKAGEVETGIGGHLSLLWTVSCNNLSMCRLLIQYTHINICQVP